MNLTRAKDLLDRVVVDTEMAAHRVGVAREFVADLAHYEAQMKTSKARLRHAVAATSTSLTDIRGVGVVTAAMIIGHVATSTASPPPRTSPATTAPPRSKRHRVTGDGIDSTRAATGS